MTVNEILAHQRAFQTIANLNGGTRASGTPGSEASVNYVARRLERGGYRVTRQKFTFPSFRDLGEPELAQVSPTAKTYETGMLTYSGGEVTGRLVRSATSPSRRGRRRARRPAARRRTSCPPILPRRRSR